MFRGEIFRQTRVIHSGSIMVRCMKSAGWLMHGADAFFGSDGGALALPPDPLRFCRRCGAEGGCDWSMASHVLPSRTPSTRGLPERCEGCGRKPNARIKQIRDAGISEVHCGWCDCGTSAKILRSWKSMPGNEASCLNAGRRLGEMLLWRCEDRFLEASALPKGDVLVPIPGWWGRRLRRGFDPPQRLAEGISEILGWPIWRPLLRVRGGRMAGRSRGQRRLASRRLFQIRSRSHVKHLQGRCLWIVDDLLVSGSTSAAAGRLLRQFRPHCVDLVVANVRNSWSGK